MQYGLRRGNREACSSAHHWGRLFKAADRTVRLISSPSQKARLQISQYLMVSRTRKNKSSQMHGDPAVISYLVLIVVLPINCCLESKSGRGDIDSVRKYSGIGNGRENERRKEGQVGVHHPRGVMVKKGSYPRISPPAFHH